MYKAIQDIAVKHGVVLGKDDPVLILQTMNERLLDENRQAQQEMLDQFKEEMENISSQWRDYAKEKAEKTLNAALVASKEVMEKTLKESTSESVQTIRKMISGSLIEARVLAQQTRKYSQFAFITSLIFLFSSLVFAFLY